MKVNKYIIAIGLFLIITGLIISCIAFLNGGMPAENPTINTLSASNEVKKIIISSNSDGVVIIPSISEEIRISYRMSDTRQYSHRTENDTLYLEYIPLKQLGLKWYQYIVSGNHRDADIVIEIPKASIKDVSITTNSGDIKLSGQFFDSFTAQTNSGDLELTDINSTKTYISTKIGDVELEGISSSVIDIETKNGDVEGIIKGSAEEYTVNAVTKRGENNIRGIMGTGIKTLNISSVSGDIEMDFIPYDNTKLKLFD